jgi:hypothetical protein
MAGLIDLGINYKRQANAGFGEVSKARTEQALFNRKMNAQNKSGAYNAAGTGLGLGYMAYQNGMIGKAAETLNASPEVVKALTPTPEAPPPGSIGGNPPPPGPGQPPGADASDVAQAVKGVPTPPGSAPTPPPTEPVVPVEPTPVAVPEVAVPEVAAPEVAAPVVAGGGEAAAAGGEAAAAGEGIGAVASNIWASLLALF